MPLETKEERAQQLQEEEHLHWLEHPRTKALRAVLQRWREEEHEKWEDGDFTHPSQDGTLQLNAEAIGRCRAARKIEQMCQDFETFQQEIEDDEQKRAGTERPSSAGPGG